MAEAGAAALADELELRRLTDAYGLAIDRGDAEAFAATFAPEGELLAFWGRGDEPLARFSTAAQLRALIEATSEAALATFHAMSNHSCRVEGDEASAESYCVARHLVEREGERVVEVVNVHYTDRCLRTAEGWRFAERRARRLWAEEVPVPAGPLLVDRGIAAALRARPRTPSDNEKGR